MRSRASQLGDGCFRIKRRLAAAIGVVITWMAAAFAQCRLLPCLPTAFCAFAAGSEEPGETQKRAASDNASDAAAALDGILSLENVRTGEMIASYSLQTGDVFSVCFIHSVNQSPVTDFYELREDGIYVVQTVYYGFGAGVQTELEEGQTLTYGVDGSMIISGFDRKMEDLIYFVGTVSDHVLTLSSSDALEEERISLRTLCGRNAMIRFSWQLENAD